MNDDEQMKVIWAVGKYKCLNSLERKVEITKKQLNQQIAGLSKEALKEYTEQIQKLDSLLSRGSQRKNQKPPLQGKETLKKLEKLGGKRVTANCISIRGEDLNKDGVLNG